ncbi:hypothetical protein ACOSP7_016561 [Xanthoceras sorbifolium]
MFRGQCALDSISEADQFLYCSMMGNEEGETYDSIAEDILAMLIKVSGQCRLRRVSVQLELILHTINSGVSMPRLTTSSMDL